MLAYLAVLRRIAAPVTSTLAILAMLLGGTSSLHAQLSSTAAISGSVADPSGAVIPNATVTVTDEATKVTTSQQTNSTGAFVFSGLPVDPYTLTISSTGFSPYKESGLVLHPGITENKDIKLKTGSTTEEVVVNAAETHVETVTPEVSSTMARSQR